MLQHLRMIEEPDGVAALRTNLAAQDETATHFRQLLESLESTFERLHSGLAMLHVGVEELAKEKKALPIRTKKALPVRKADKPKTHPRLACSAQRLLDRPASPACGF